jgi:hypothetical protein
MFDLAHWERRAGVDPNVTVGYFFCKKCSVSASDNCAARAEREGLKKNIDKKSWRRI